MVEEPYLSIPIVIPPTVTPTLGETPVENVASSSATTTEQVASPSAHNGPEPVAQDSSEDDDSVAPSDAPLQEP
jgi:hypothetical protein